MTKLLKSFFVAIIIFNNIAFAKGTGFDIGVESMIVEPVASKVRYKHSNTTIILNK